MRYDDAVLADIFGGDWLGSSSIFEWRDGGVFLRKIPENVAALLRDDELAVLRAHPTGNRGSEPVLTVPFDLDQFLTFIRLHPVMRDSIESDYESEVAFVSTSRERMLVPDEESIAALTVHNPAAARLVRLVVARATESVDTPAVSAIPATGTESPEARRKRLAARHGKLKAQGVHNPTEIVATEEGISVERVRQLLRSANRTEPREPIASDPFGWPTRRNT